MFLFTLGTNIGNIHFTAKENAMLAAGLLFLGYKKFIDQIEKHGNLPWLESLSSDLKFSRICNDSDEQDHQLDVSISICIS